MPSLLECPGGLAVSVLTQEFQRTKKHTNYRTTSAGWSPQQLLAGMVRGIVKNPTSKACSNLRPQRRLAFALEFHPQPAQALLASAKVQTAKREGESFLHGNRKIEPLQLSNSA